MVDMNFEDLGRFIYGAARHGGGLEDVTDWMADDSGVARLIHEDEDAMRTLCRAFFAKYQDNDALRENYEHFMEALKNRVFEKVIADHFTVIGGSIAHQPGITTSLPPSGMNGPCSNRALVHCFNALPVALRTPEDIQPGRRHQAEVPGAQARNCTMRACRYPAPPKP